MKRWFLMGLILALVITACAPAMTLQSPGTGLPFEVKNIKIIAGCDCTCLTWETTVETQCRVVWCKDDKCFASDLEPEFSTTHAIQVPTRWALTIIATDRQNRTVETDVVP